MPAKRVTTVTLPVDGRAVAAFESYRNRSPLLTITAVRPALLVTLTLPEHLDAGHVEFARALARSATVYAMDVERRFRGLPPLQPSHRASWTWPAVATLWADSLPGPHVSVMAPAGAVITGRGFQPLHSRGSLRKEPPS